MKYNRSIMRRIVWHTLVLSVLCTFGAANAGEQGLVAHYAFNEGSGTSTADASGSGNTGTINGATWTALPSGQCLSYDGVDDYIDFGNQSSLDITGSITTAAWIQVRPSQSQAESGILGKSMDSYLLTYYSNDGRLYWYINAGSNGVSAPVTANTWYYVATTFNGATLRIYLNGKLVSERASSQSSINSFPAYHFFTGCQGGSGGANSHFNGSVDEVRVYNRAFSAREISMLYRAENLQNYFTTVTVSAVDEQYMFLGYPTAEGTYWYGRQKFNLTAGQTYLVQAQTTGGYDSANLTVAADGTVMAANATGNLHQFEVWGRNLVVYNPTHVAVSPSDDLKAAIEGAGSVTSVDLSAGSFSLTQTIAVQDKREFRIAGTGAQSTTVHVASDVYISFRIGSNLSNLRIENFGIKGTLPLQINTHGVASVGGTDNVRGVTITGLQVEDVAIGISVGAGPPYTYDDVEVSNNRVLRTAGIVSGSGYGIHDDYASNLTITGNFIERATRHSIYVGRGNTNITVENNFVLDHDLKREIARLNPYAAAIAIARTSDARIANNIVINSPTVSLSVEYDDTDPANHPVDNVVLVNNRIIAPGFYGIWVNSGLQHEVLGNSIVRAPGAGYDAIQLTANSYTGSPSSLVAPDPRWANLNLIAELAGYDYVMTGLPASGILDKVTPYRWAYSTHPVNWYSTAAMTGLENARGAGAHRLYLVQNGVLHEVNPENGQYIWTANWSGTKFMAATSGYVHIMRNNTLYRVTPGSLRYVRSTENWSGTLAMIDWGGSLYIIKNNGYHYTLDPYTLRARPARKGVLPR